MDLFHTADLVFERKIRGHLPVTRMSVGDAGSIITAVPDDHRPRLYHLVRFETSGDWEEIGEFSVETLLHHDFSEDGKSLVAATDDDLYVFRNDSKARFFPERRDNYASVSISAVGDLFAVGSSDLILSSHSVTLARTTGGQVWIKDLPVTVSFALLTPDARSILVGSEEGTCLMLDIARQIIWQVEGPDPVTAMAVTRTGDMSVIGDKGGTVTVVGAEGVKLWQSFGDPVVRCAVSSDGSLIVVCRQTNRSTRAVEFLLSDGTPAVEHVVGTAIDSIACSPNGRFAALSLDDGTIQALELTLASPRARSMEVVAAFEAQAAEALAAGDYSLAVERFTRVLELSPSNVNACRKLVEATDALVRSYLDGALEVAEETLSLLHKAVELRPHDCEVLARLNEIERGLIHARLETSRSLVQDGKLQEARSVTEEVLDLDFTNIKARELLNDIEAALVADRIADAEQASCPAEAIRFLEEAAAVRPTPDVYERLSAARAKQAFDEGLVLYEAQRYSEAVFQFKKVLKLDPENAEARKYMEYGESLRRDDSLFDRFSKLE